jgi:hypothetical protein
MTNTEKTLKNIFSLDHNVRLYIPGTINLDQKIDTSEYTQKTLKLFSKWFGGSTKHNAIEGGWLASTGEVVTEPVTIIESYASNDAIEEHIGDVLALAKKIKKELKQEAVSLEYDNKLYLV